MAENLFAMECKCHASCLIIRRQLRGMFDIRHANPSITFTMREVLKNQKILGML